MAPTEQNELLRKAVDDFRSRKCWGKIELAFRAGEIEVVTKTETLKGTTQTYDRNAR